MAKRILVADDSVTIQKAFAMVFAGSDFTLVSARSVDEAVSAARHGRPDLVIADAVLGGGNGYDLCSTLKADPGLRNVPVVILNSNQSPYDETRGHRVGAAGSVIKPFDSQALADQVSGFLARPDGRSTVGPAPGAVQPSMVRDLTERVGGEGLAAGADDEDDDYGEFTIERPGGGSGAAPMPARPMGGSPRTVIPTPAPAPSRSVPAMAAPAPSLRPSLIPGVRPAAPIPPRQPAQSERPPLIPERPPLTVERSAAAPLPERSAPAPLPERPSMTTASMPVAAASARSTGSRTMTGLPAMAPPVQAPRSIPIPSSPMPRAPSAPVPLLNTQVLPPPPTVSSHPVPTAPFPLVAQSQAASAMVANAVAQKVAAISARGPEYEAIAKLTREVIEQVVWEVVPELAEVIIRQEIDRLANKR
jgi:CheY-like chemotaxis protein